MVVSGNYRDAGLAANAAVQGTHPVEDGASVFFGGTEFRLFGSEGLSGLAAGEALRLRPRSMSVTQDKVSFTLDDGTRLEFDTQFSEGSEALSIRAALGRTYSDLRLPFRPLRSSKVTEEKGKLLIVSSDSEYSFGASKVDSDKRLVSFSSKAPVVSYGIVPAIKAFSPGSFVVSAAANQQSYDRALQRWRDQAYVGWERAMAGSVDEDTVAAYIQESALRGNYRSAVATVPVSFLEGAQRSFRTSVYLGRLDLALRTLSSADRETLARLSREANEKSPDLLSEPGLVSFLAVRGSNTLLNDTAALARSIDPAVMTPLLAVGTLEAWRDWKLYRPGVDNPFDRLVDQAKFVLSSIIKRAGDTTVLAFPGGQGGTAFSLRLGMALEGYGSAASQSDWAGLGRSLILSVLSLADQGGSAPAAFQLSQDGTSVAPLGEGRLSAASLYRSIAPEGFASRSVRVSGDAMSGIWAWSAASDLTLSYTDGALDLAADFPIGETHYLLIRGVKSFTKIQLYGIDFRTDPRFERYDSSGWAYSASEQTLLVKMKHRSPTEHVKVFF